MKKAILFIAVFAFSIQQLWAAGSWKMNPHTGKLDYYEKGQQACTDIFDGTAGSAIYTGTIDPNISVNVAPSGTASASSEYTIFGAVASRAINNERRASLGAWVDNTPNVFPDWLQVTLPAVRTINRINVYSNGHIGDSSEPALTSTSSSSIKDYDVEYWNGSAWVVVPGGTIRNTNNIWRQITFSPIATDKIRVWVLASNSNSSTINELEAYTPVAGLVTDVYINTLTGDLYRMDTLGVWTLKGNIKGVQGNAGTMAVGTVTTLAPASPATVVFTGPSTARVINFGIPKGDPGVPAAVDFPSVQTALGTANDGTITLLSSTATEHTRFAVKNSGASIVFGITDRGLITVQNTAGVQLWSFSPTASTLTLKTKSGRTIFKVMSSAAGGTLTL